MQVAFSSHIFYDSGELGRSHMWHSIWCMDKKDKDALVWHHSHLDRVCICWIVRYEGAYCSISACMYSSNLSCQLKKRWLKALVLLTLSRGLERPDGWCLKGKAAITAPSCSQLQAPVPSTFSLRHALSPTELPPNPCGGVVLCMR